MELQLGLMARNYIRVAVRELRRDVPFVAIIRRKHVNRLHRQPMHPGFQLHAFWTLVLFAEGVCNRLPHYVPCGDLAGLELPLAFAVVDFSLDEALQSEEHTSELQSLRHLVCRLLL